MRASGLKYETARWDFSANGYDTANSRFTDQGALGLGLHLQVTGTPAFNTRGQLCADCASGWYAELANFDLDMWTMVLCTRSSLTGGDQVAAMKSDATGVQDGDHTVSTFKDAFGTSGRSQLLYYAPNSAQFLDIAGGVAATATLGTVGSAQAVVIENYPPGGKRRIQVNNGAVVSVQEPAYFELSATRRWRFGTSVTLTGSNYVAIHEARLFADALITNQSGALGAFVAGLLSDHP